MLQVEVEEVKRKRKVRKRKRKERSRWKRERRSLSPSDKGKKLLEDRARRRKLLHEGSVDNRLSTEKKFFRKRFTELARHFSNGYSIEFVPLESF